MIVIFLIVINILGWGGLLVFLNKRFKKIDQSAEPQFFEGPLLIGSYYDDKLDKMAVFDSSAQPMSIIYINPEEEIKMDYYEGAIIMVDADGAITVVLPEEEEDYDCGM